MESLIPTVTISINNNKYEILELTVNPIFAIGILFFKIWPKRYFKVWVELVLGHNSDEELSIPEVHFSFNSAFHFTRNMHPPLDDRDMQISGGKSANAVLYKHFWFNEIPFEKKDIYDKASDILISAYGANAIRLVPKEYKGMSEKSKKEVKKPNLNLKECDKVRAALAFYRSSYAQEKNKRYERINYPSTFNAKSGKPREIILTPRPFDLYDFSPSVYDFKLNKEESISFWYYYDYSEQTAAYADDEHKDQISFLNRVIINPELKDIGINYFPRLPFRYEVISSIPKLVSSPRLPIDPPVWGCKEQLYPLRIIDTHHENRHWLNRSKSVLDFFATIRDRKVESDRNVVIIMQTVLIGLISRCVMHDKLWIGLLFGIFIASLLLNIYRLFRFPHKSFFKLYCEPKQKIGGILVITIIILRCSLFSDVA